ILGELDGLNSWLGICSIESKKIKKSKINFYQNILYIQNNIFIIQSQIAAKIFKIKSKHKIQQKNIDYLEKIIKIIDQKIPPIKKFIIPGGTKMSSYLDYARTLTRKTERICIKNDKKNIIDQLIKVYLNRLSSFLFALARYANFIYRIKEKKPSY
ncbi:MAG: cob(I)yrinic acid a,c-diamide adenosyltransferase, partial [Minisyncoccia bacterium]